MPREPADEPRATDASAAYLGGPERRGCYDAAAPRKAPKVRWVSARQQNGGSEYGGSPVVDAGLGLVFAADVAANAHCSASRLSDGKSVWKTALTKGQSWIVGSAVVDRGVVYQATNKNLFALDAKTGKQRWSASLSAVEGSPVVVGDLVFIGTGEGLLGLSLANGRKQWAFGVKRNEFKQGVIGGVAFADGIFYFVADKLFAVDLETKKARWMATGDGRATPSVDAGSVYTWSPAGLTAIHRETGKVRWVSKFKEDNYETSIAVGHDKVVARADGRLVAFDKSKGKKLWTVATKSPWQIGGGSPIIAGDVALCVLVEEDNDDPILHAVDLATGKVLWKRDKFLLPRNEKAPLSYYCTPAVTSDGTVLVQAYGLHALR